MATRYEGEPEQERALDAYVKLMRSANSVQCALAEHLKKVGLTESQLGVLEMLLHLGPLKQHQIGRKLLISRANVTLLVDQLSGRELIRRERDPDDRRAVQVHLTPAGRRFIGGIFPNHLRAIVGIFSVLSADEQIELARLCRKLGLRQQEPADES